MADSNPVEAPIANAPVDGPENGTVEQPVPSHRSHDPNTNAKQSDPFQFGNRYLKEGDDIYEFNAWDHVEQDDAYREYTAKQLEMQRQSPVTDFDKGE